MSKWKTGISNYLRRSQVVCHVGNAKWKSKNLYSGCIVSHNELVEGIKMSRNVNEAPVALG